MKTGMKPVTFGKVTLFSQRQFPRRPDNWGLLTSRTPRHLGNEIFSLEAGSRWRITASVAVLSLCHSYPFLFASFACSNSSTLVGLFFCEKLSRGRLVRWPTTTACVKVPRDSHFPASLPSILDSLYFQLDLPGLVTYLIAEGPELLVMSFYGSYKYTFTSKLGQRVPRLIKVNFLEAK